MFHIHPRLCSHSVSNFPDWSPYISFKNSWLREFGLRSKNSPFGNQFSNSHNLYSWWSADVVRRKLMLVTLGTKSVNSYLAQQAKAFVPDDSFLSPATLGKQNIQAYEVYWCFQDAGGRNKHLRWWFQILQWLNYCLQPLDRLCCMWMEWMVLLTTVILSSGFIPSQPPE